MKALSHPDVQDGPPVHEPLTGGNALGGVGGEVVRQDPFVTVVAAVLGSLGPGCAGVAGVAPLEIVEAEADLLGHLEVAGRKRQGLVEALACLGRCALLTAGPRVLEEVVAGF